ncbi:hypothetical protein U1Q18_016684 [Sarracenia purpurea var. burkii]
MTHVALQFFDPIGSAMCQAALALGYADHVAGYSQLFVVCSVLRAWLLAAVSASLPALVFFLRQSLVMFLCFRAIFSLLLLLK